VELVRTDEHAVALTMPSGLLREEPVRHQALSTVV
jgi:hypothetical protein